MMNRAWNILISTSAMDARQLFPALVRMSVPFVLFLTLLLAASLTPAGFITSGVLQFLFYLLSLIGVVVSAGFATHQQVGSRQSLFISLVALTGTTSVQWCCTCLLEIWRTFLLIWITRIPVLTWLQTQGNLDLQGVALFELTLLCLFAWLSSLGLLIGSRKSLKGVTFGIAVAGYFGWEVVCNLSSILAMIANYYSIESLEPITELGAFLVHFSIFRKTYSLVTGGFDTAHFISLNIVLLIFAGICLVRFTRTIYRDIGANTIGIEGESAANSPVRKKKIPRCWSNALAWQAFYYHHGGYSTVYIRIVVYFVYLVLIAGMNYFQLSFTEYGSVLFAGIGLVMGPLMVANVCLAKESKEQTLSSLIMAVGDPVSLYEGWQNARLRMTIPDLVLLPAILFALYWSSPVIAYSVACGIPAIAYVTPLMYLSSFLAAWTWRNVKLSGKIFLSLCLIGGIGTLVGWLLSWYLLPVIGIPLLYLLGQRTLHKELPELFDPFFGTNNSG